jgi:hypothetical protein
MTIELQTVLNKQGAWTVEKLVEGGNDRVGDFLAKVKQQQFSKYLQIIGDMNFIVQNGPPMNQEKFRKEEGVVFALKCKPFRLYCFFDGPKRLVFTNGAQKKQPKADANDLALCARVHKELTRQRKERGASRNDLRH